MSMPSIPSTPTFVSNQNFLLQLEKNERELLKSIQELRSFADIYIQQFKSPFTDNFSQMLFQKEDRPIDTPNDIGTKDTLLNDQTQTAKKKAGRKCGNLGDNKEEKATNTYMNVHSKHTKDNVRRKVKVQFTHFLINFTNQVIKVNWHGFQKYKFRTIDNKITKDISILTNKKLFHITIGQYLSLPVSSKFKCESQQNKKIAEKIKKEKPEVFRSYLQMEMVDFYNNIYRGNPYLIRREYKLDQITDEKNKTKLMFFDEYLNTLQQDEKYMMIYYRVGKEFFSFYSKQKGRKPRSKKNTDDNEDSFFNDIFN